MENAFYFKPCIRSIDAINMSQWKSNSCLNQNYCDNCIILLGTSITSCEFACCLYVINEIQFYIIGVALGHIMHAIFTTIHIYYSVLIVCFKKCIVHCRTGQRDAFDMDRFQSVNIHNNATEPIHDEILFVINFKHSKHRSCSIHK